MMNVLLVSLCDSYYISQIAESLFIGFTLYFTIKNFGKIALQSSEMKNQTNMLQEQLNYNQNAALRLEIKNCKKLEDSINSDHMQEEKHTKIFNLIRSNYENTSFISADDYIVLCITNHGFTDVVEAEIEYTIQIDLSTLDFPLDDLKQNEEVRDRFVWKGLLKKDQSSVILALSPSYAYPKYKTSVHVNYTDARDKKYTVEKTEDGDFKNFAYGSTVANKIAQTSIDKPAEKKEI
jgi:hypothetical protein